MPIANAWQFAHLAEFSAATTAGCRKGGTREVAAFAACRRRRRNCRPHGTQADDNSALSLGSTMAASLHCRVTMQTNISQLSVHDPDGVPHEIIGLTFVVAVAIAIVAFAALAMGGVASGLALVIVPLVVFALSRRAGSRRATRNTR